MFESQKNKNHTLHVLTYKSYTIVPIGTPTGLVRFIYLTGKKASLYLKRYSISVINADRIF